MNTTWLVTFCASLLGTLGALQLHAWIERKRDEAFMPRCEMCNAIATCGRYRQNRETGEMKVIMLCMDCLKEANDLAETEE